MLTVNQKQRIDAVQALNSQWLLEHEKRSTAHRPDFIKRIKQFNAKRKFKGGVKAVIATNRMKNLTSPSATDRNTSTSSNGSNSQQQQQQTTTPNNTTTASSNNNNSTATATNN